jgi:hypothetical protein
MYGIEPVDELTHEPHDDPAWRESYWIDMVDPARGIGVLAYAGSQPMAGTGYSLIHVARPGEILYQHREFGLELPERYEPGRSSIEIGPFASTVTKSLERQAVRYGRDGFSLDVGFGSSAPVYDYPWPWTRSRHWEQFGDVAGSLVLDGEQLEINGRGVRDHAWGLRSLRPWRRWLWTTFRAAEGGTAWSLCMVEDDERDGLYGYLLDDGGGVHTLRRLEAEIAYDGEAPASVSLRFACGKRDPIEVSATLFGLIDLSHQDAAKQGGYFFSFLEVGSGPLRGFGTFDVFWRHDLSRPQRFEHGL